MTFCFRAYDYYRLLIPIICPRAVAACARLATARKTKIRLKIYLSVLEGLRHPGFTPRYLRTFCVSYAGGTQRLGMEMRLAPSGLEVGGIIVIYRPRKVGLILSEIGCNEVILDPQFAEWTISAQPDWRNGRPCYGQKLIRGALH